MGTDRLDRIALILAAGSAGFCAGEMLSPVTGNAQHVQWETLLTGVLAIAAAAWSVRATRQVNAEEGKRHQQTTALQIRGDMLRLERAVYPIAMALEELGVEIDKAIGAYNTEKQSGAHPSVLTMDTLQDLALEAAELINNERLTRAEDLFEPGMLMTYDALRQVGTELYSAHENLKSARNRPENVIYPEMPSNDVSDLVSTLVIQLYDVSPYGLLFSQELQWLRDNFAEGLGVSPYGGRPTNRA